MTLQEILQTKLAQIEATYQADKAEVEAAIAKLAPSGWLTTEIETVKEWFQAVGKHLGL